MADATNHNTTQGTGARPVRFTFGRAQKLKGKTLVDRIYKTGQKRVAHPLLVYGVRRADHGPARLGISIGKRCGNAVARNRIKRRLREAYRLLQHELPPGVDWLIVVKPHAHMKMAWYQDRLRMLLR